MKHRFAPLAAIVLFLALGAFAAYMWYGPDYPVYLKPGEAQLVAMVTGLGRRGGPLLTVRIRNQGRTGIMVASQPGFGEPLRVVLVNQKSGKEVPRKPAAEKADLRPRNVLKNSHISWSVRLNRLYGELPPGRYGLKATYDTQTAAEGGRDWARGLDVGRLEAMPVVFEVKEKKPD